MDMTSLINVLDQELKCGSIPIPGKLAYIISMVILIIQYFVPILLIIWGMLDLGKAVIASKEDEIKKGQQTFIKRIIAAIIVFFIVSIVKLVVNLVADPADKTGMTNCIKDLVNYHNKYNKDAE
jgi:hypothetical protein